MSEGARPWRTPAPRAAALGRVLGALARASLVVGTFAMTTGCLITDPPQFKPAKHSRPFLANPDPPPGMVRVVDSTSMQGTISFSADVFSQDDPPDPSAPSAFQTVKAYFYVDYGFGSPGSDLRPWRSILPPLELDSSTIDQGPHRVQFDVTVQTQLADLGCHNATLIVSHKFDSVSACPVCNDDFAMITWPIFRCDKSTDMSSCDEFPISGSLSSCDQFKNSCAAVRDGGATCADGGTE